MAGKKGRSGRPRKPTKLRIHEGNRSRTPIPREVEPTGVAKKPQRFSDPLVKKAWEKLTPPLFAIGLATDADQCQLERMCYWWAEAERYKRGTDEYDFGRCERATRMFNSLAAGFGMTPRDRAGLDVGSGRSEGDTEKFLA